MENRKRKRTEEPTDQGEEKEASSTGDVAGDAPSAEQDGKQDAKDDDTYLNRREVEEEEEEENEEQEGKTRRQGKWPRTQKDFEGDVDGQLEEMTQLGRELGQTVERGAVAETILDLLLRVEGLLKASQGELCRKLASRMKESPGWPVLANLKHHYNADVADTAVEIYDIVEGCELAARMSQTERLIRCIGRVVCDGCGVRFDLCEHEPACLTEVRRTCIGCGGPSIPGQPNLIRGLGGGYAPPLGGWPVPEEKRVEADAGPFDQNVVMSALGLAQDLKQASDKGEDSRILTVLDRIDEVLKHSSGPTRRHLLDKFEESMALDRLEQLQQHHDELIYEKAVSILENYFAAEYEEY